MVQLTMISFELPFPPSNNTYYRKVNNRVIISKKGREYRKRVKQCISLYGLNKTTIDYKVLVRVELHQPDLRTRDSDNFSKALYDALTKAGFWLDDSLAVESQFRLEPKSIDPRAVLFVYPDIEGDGFKK
jgi:crossover junction endodeoxyribonuclease RusA